MEKRKRREKQENKRENRKKRRKKKKRCTPEMIMSNVAAINFLAVSLLLLYLPGNV